MKFLLYAALFLSLALPVSATVKDDVHPDTHYFEMFDTFNNDGHCSATTVGPHAVLTAGHCDVASNEIALDGTKYTVTEKLYDGEDHVIYIVDGTFKNYAHLAPREPAVGEHVFIYGNPGETKDFYRDGNYSRLEHMREQDVEMFMMPVYGGDSGSGIFDDKGNVIGVVSLGDSNAQAGVLPMAFTDKQLAEANKE